MSDPYAIWVSEMMLQQTQASVVIPYFLRWMERFPTIASLARSSLDEVLKAWEGLGYYSRARRLHEGAKYLLLNCGGRLPDREDELVKIKGLGPYTVGAILSFAFHQKRAAVDGNVVRVLTRYFSIHEDVNKSATMSKLRSLAQSLLPEEQPWVITEALIELGATICQPKPRCVECPLQSSCQAYLLGNTDSLPTKGKRVETTHLHRAVAVVKCGFEYLVQRGKKGMAMSDLFEFPYFEIPVKKKTFSDVDHLLRNNLPFPLHQKKLLAEVSHTYTRYHVRLYPILYHCEEKNEMEGLQWLSEESLRRLAFSSGHRRILQQL